MNWQLIDTHPSEGKFQVKGGKINLVGGYVVKNRRVRTVEACGFWLHLVDDIKTSDELDLFDATHWRPLPQL